MKIISGKLLGHKYTLHRIRDAKGRYISGSVVLREFTGEKTVLKREDSVGIQDMIMMINLSPLLLLKLFIYSLLFIKEYRIKN